ncbi:MAG: hypothetical protein ACT4P1_09265 [Sporichthyaceae bacterium]
MSAHAFVDESKHRGLVLVAAVVAPRDLAAVRATMRGLCMKGQSRVHFTKERTSRRGEIISAICGSAVVLDIYDASAIADEKLARRACLQRLAAELGRIDGQRLVLEQDDSLVAFDQGVLYSAVRQEGLVDLLSYEHLPARSEPLLWVADAAAWCWTHGGRWKDRIRPLVRGVYRL